MNQIGKKTLISRRTLFLFTKKTLERHLPRSTGCVIVWRYLIFGTDKHGAILYNEGAVFSLSIKNPNARSMVLFEWLIYSNLKV